VNIIYYESINFFLLNSDRSKKPFSSLIQSVLPALAKKSFLNVGEQCPEEQGTVYIYKKCARRNRPDRYFEYCLHCIIKMCKGGDARTSVGTVITMCWRIM